MSLEVVHLTQELVKIPSTTGNEAKIAQFIYDTLRPYADRIEIDKKGNVEAKIIFDKKRPTVLFNGHVDTVDPGEMEAPFSGRIVDGKPFGVKGKVIYGRGSVDMKGGVAVAMTVFSKLKDLPNPPNLVVHFVTEEETGQGPGTKFAMKNLEEKLDIAISGEPTGLDICLGFRGWVQFQLETYGKTAHASNPDQGINAIFYMRDFLNALDEYIAKQEARIHPFLGKLTSTVTNIECSPGRLSVVPDLCRLTFDSRYFPEESYQDREKELQILLGKIKQKNPRFKSNLKVLYSGMRPTFLPPENKYVQFLKKAFFEVNRREAVLRSWRFTTDSSYIVNNFGIPTIGFGPGFENVVHTPLEQVPVEHLKITEKVYLAFLSILAT